MRAESPNLSDTVFSIDAPRFAPETGVAEFGYGLGSLHFVERLTFPTMGLNAAMAEHPAFGRLLELTAAVLGVSYFKLLAPFVIDAKALALDEAEQAFVIDLYENGLGEFYARNDLKRFGRLTLETTAPHGASEPLNLPSKALVPIGGGKDSLVSLDLLERAGLDMALFAVNPKGPILGSVSQANQSFVSVKRALDGEMVRLGKEPGYYNGHVPSTAIISMIASLAALLFGFDRIVLSNERSASEGNLVFDGREANHQYSKSLAFEKRISEVLASATGGALGYFSLLRPYSEAKIASLFARTHRFDTVFSSCNENFKLNGNTGPLWCGKCPKCHFVFLILAPAMQRDRLVGIFGQNVLDNADNIPAYRELTGLSGHKPWECVGEILEAAACLYTIADHPDWRDTAVAKTLRPALEDFYGPGKLHAAYTELFADSSDHLIPTAIETLVVPHAH